MSGKRFLAIVGAVSVVVWGALQLLGPPGMSKAYLEKHQHEHERYLSIIKDESYHKYMQRPWLNVGAISEEDLDFARDYAANPSFIQEEHRRGLYGALCDIFNAALVVVIAYRFGKAPLLNFLDTQLAELRHRLDEAAKGREAAEARKAKAQTNIAQLPAEEEEVQRETRHRLDRELADLDEANQHSLRMIEAELADRRREERKNAALVLKRELVNQAVDQLAAAQRAKDAPEGHAVLFDGFLEEVERLA